MSLAQFELTPEQESTATQFFYRQLFFSPPPLTPDNTDVGGKTAIVTGSNSGVGFECASQLLDLGLEKVILAVRNEQAGQEARKTLLARHHGSEDKIEVWRLDMNDYDSILAFAKRAETLERLDIAILNAAVRKAAQVFNPATGYEEDVQVNFLSTVLLALCLLPIMKSKRWGADPGRMALVSSDSARTAVLAEAGESPMLPAFKRPQPGFTSAGQYNKSKLLAQLVMPWLKERASGCDVVVNMVTPGFCRRTGIMKELYGPVLQTVSDLATWFFGRSAAVGARIVVHAAVKSGPESHGHYIGDYKLKPMARLVYTEEGEALSQSLWRELMSEFSFAPI
ncbi:NAD(P)-binding protein [Xylariomycetidae sp. FL2044]|nr:NAD(P)-binding protein [Xylariomycetidae sp. FL2044]